MAQSPDPSLFNGLHWRLVGPFRGGRALAVTGVPGQPEKFYFGAVGGGVWETENAGRTWTPIFDKEPVASIGAIAVAPSDTNIIYVGSGEADMRSDIQQGNGMYKSTDSGRTWSHIGLDDTRQIGKILVDPKNPDAVYVAALGHQYGPNEERGVFKTVDGGKTWAKVLYKDADTGAIDLAMDPTDSKVIFASMWQTRRPPWSVYPPSNGPGSGLYKSEDGGESWTEIGPVVVPRRRPGDRGETGPRRPSGFPGHVGHVGLAISPPDHNRIYTCVDTNDPKTGGVYRSDDGGTTWTHSSGDSRIWGRGWYFMGITADPKDPDVVYVMNTSAYRSTDGGKTFTPFKGAPGGDDYHTCWIYPDDPNRMILGSDQGTVISVDGGKTWSSWYNQPTGQFYHVIADNRDPYWIYGAQQDSGGMAVPSRTIHTGISALYQRPIDAGGESGTVAPDPLHPGLLYSSGGSKELFDTAWQQATDPTLARTDTIWRNEWTMPIVISPANPRAIYTSRQKIFRSVNGGENWRIISPDLTRPKNVVPPNLDPVTAGNTEGHPRPGVVYWIAPSPIRAAEIWAGTDDGLIWLTRDDGAHWRNVTPEGLTPWSKVGVIDASHFSPETAYAAIDRHRVDDNHPYIYRTHDGGRHWALVNHGIPENQFVNVVREDPRQPGLLYAGTDWGVYVSFDDGGHWQSLQLNLPPASVRDLVFGNGDVIVGTHGRAIWILDDPAMLREVASTLAVRRRPLTRARNTRTSSPPEGRGDLGSPPFLPSSTHLFKPSPALLFQRAGTFGFGAFDEGTPLPPEEPQGENPPWGAIFDYVVGTPSQVDFEIMDAHGKLMRRLSSTDKHPQIRRRQLDIPAYWIHPGPALSSEAGGHRYVWNLRYQNDRGPLVPPGRYTVRMTASGRTVSQPLTVVRDRRVSASDADLRAQFRLALQVSDELTKVNAAIARAQALLRRGLPRSKVAHLKRLLGAPTDPRGLQTIAATLNSLNGAIQSAPAAPTNEFRRVFARLKRFASQDIAALGARL